MQTTTVMASELGDDWRPSAHMPRVLASAKHIKEGDQVRVRDHRDPERGEGTRRWHLVTVLGMEVDRSMVTLMTNKWPIAYVCSSDELVELVDIRREVEFRCVICHRADHQDKTTLTVMLKDFIDPELMRAGGLDVIILPDTQTREQTGYCKEHGATFLS